MADGTSLEVLRAAFVGDRDALTSALRTSLRASEAILSPRDEVRDTPSYTALHLCALVARQLSDSHPIRVQDASAWGVRSILVARLGKRGWWAGFVRDFESFSVEDESRLGVLLPTLGAAWDQSLELQRLRCLQDSLDVCLDGTAVGILQVDRSGHIQARIGCPEVSSDDLILHPATLAALAAETPSVITIPATSNRSPWIVRVHPCSRLPLATLVIFDPQRSANADGGTLRRSFGLTHAESRLAEALARGCCLKDASIELGVELSTVRSQLHQLLLKTGTDRQATLVPLIQSAGFLNQL